MGSLCRSMVCLALILLSTLSVQADTTGNKISGRVIDAAGNKPMPGAVISLKDTFLWAVSDSDGEFTIQGVQGGSYTLQASLLGYVTVSLRLSVESDIENIIIPLIENTLKLDGVTVTAQSGRNALNTIRTIESNALDHLQASNVSDIAALLPGGKTSNPDLTKDNLFSLRDGGLSSGNASFGTAVEIDGVRLGNNSSFDAMSGTDTRNIAISNIQSVEVVTGVASAEYGDLNSGIVRINTRKGRTPLEVVMAVNPRTRQTAFAKGLDLGEDKGVLNLSGEWANATRQLTSPYTSYTRRGISVSYGNIFNRSLKFDAGITGNLGGMNSEDDPDAYSGEFTKVRDNVLRANASLAWLLNRSWITNLKFDASVNFNDNLSRTRTYNSYASQQPAPHAEEEGYFIADRLPYTFFADRVVDSKQLDFAASAKYEWNRHWNDVRSNMKAGVQWKATGNAGEGEYYLDPSLAAGGYRPRPYTDYPYMHNVAFYVEENLSLPVGNTTLQVMAGVRAENLFVRGTGYTNLNSLSPRFNAKWRLSENIAVRGGWGVAEKLPSYNVLFPRQEYRDTQTFGVSYNNNESIYVYHTQPYTLQYNEDLRWQRNHNSELGVDISFAGIDISLVGFYNITKSPYKVVNTYTPFSYNILQLPDGFSMPADPSFKLDHQTGMLYVRGDGNDYWTPMEVKVTDRTFVKTSYSGNGADITRSGIELVADFPEIRPIRTRLRLDAAYNYTYYVDDSPAWYYQAGWSHLTIPDRSYQYVGIYANGNGTSLANGKRTHSLDANITVITHIPRARLIVTCRVEMSLLKRSQNLSVYNGEEYAYSVGRDSDAPTGESIYSGNTYTAVRPVAYVDLDGNIHPYTDADAADPELSRLILRSGNAYTFAPDGYDPYFSANINITKEIGNHVSLSFFANNFTKTKQYVTSYATGVKASFTPAFYYGLTCRIRF